MSEELQNPPVVDLDLIFQPIAGENPAGESLRYSGIYDEMREARRADENLAQGAWQTELKVADFPKVLNLGIDALTTKSKDLQVAAWTCEALVKLHGFAGFRDGLKIIAGLQEHFWEPLHPEIDEGDQESRANAIAWVDEQVAQAIKGAPFTGVAGYSYADWQDSQKFDFPESVEGLTTDDAERIRKLKEQAETERRVTADLWRKEINQTRRAAVESVNLIIEECWQALNDLNRVIEEKFDRNQAPALGVLKKSLEDVEAQMKMLLTAKRAEEPDAIEEEEGSGEEGDGAAVEGGVRKGAIQSRRDALSRLSDIAEFFRRSEPHSPVSYLVQKAVKWGEMPLELWLQEVVKDPGVLYQLKETLGVVPGSEG
ncbi:MAG: type VI secretion system protein TssA [Pyrinomonadaceae bacterium]